MQAPRLVTDRLILTGAELGLFEAQYAIFADPRVMARLNGGPPQSREEAWRRYLGQAGLWALLGYGWWTVLERAGGAVVGTVGIGRFEREVPELVDLPETGWAFAYDCWGRGYATEAVGAMLKWTDAALPFAETRCFIDAGNEASRRVAEKCGYRPFAEVTAYGRPSLVLSRQASANRPPPGPLVTAPRE